MLLTKIDKTIDIINHGLEISDLKNKNRRAQNLTAKLKEINELLIQLTGIQNEFSSRNNQVLFDINIKNFRNKLNEISNLIKINEIPNDKVVTDIQKELRNNYSDLVSKWKLFVKGRIAPITELLAILKELLENDQEINLIIFNLNKLQQNDPEVKSFEQLDRWIEKGKTVITNLQLNDEIIAFIKKVYSAEATVKDLSPQVLEWLGENELMGSLKLSFKR